ncbi:hypothetical protein [Glutamicibacter protophormiae]|uniref:Vitamin K epoxide reductase domain-containing protein n=1 Tax=Glutamicibacter protophormiae TaxID=37930 RepID=A0ABS4XNQ9_GLUPR|nr:hypothetical protein [Glutamicibacter protophormiae]MBP2398155.1 hypothetical protein [Glutamicibacter protophormiae]QRQ78891.1 hypothetical protein JQN66_01065 [Glutamicibacter protophormiae]GGL99253.1 hypothetical protein GCM10010038_31720 [Glutamicibacter protophormiae]
MENYRPRRRVWKFVLIAVGLYLGLTLLVALNYAARSCLGAGAELHCSMSNTVVWGEHRLLGFIALIYLVLVVGLWVKHR